MITCDEEFTREAEPVSRMLRTAYLLLFAVEAVLVFGFAMIKTSQGLGPAWGAVFAAPFAILAVLTVTPLFVKAATVVGTTYHYACSVCGYEWDRSPGMPPSEEK